MNNEQIKIYKTLRAARCAASHIRKQEQVKRCNVFLKTVFLKSGLAKKDKRGNIVCIPAVYIVRAVDDMPKAPPVRCYVL